MCGICGFIQRDASVLGHADTLTPMLAAIAHRGPDGEGTSIEHRNGWVVALGHRRLAIIDLETGAQPMATDGAKITYNGELYNHRELRRKLTERGRVFRTKSDTEALLCQVAEHGVGGLAALNGMFAFAVWDDRKRQLVLGRDRAGIKPLYYAELPDGGIAFASELASLMKHPGLAGASRELSQEGLLSYFFSDYVQAPHTMIAGARKLRPGHYLVWEDGVLSEQRPFWSARAPRSDLRQSEGELAAELWANLDTAVERQLLSDVPIGIFLSGGLDSSAVASLAAARSERRMKAFSIAFEDPTFDESAHARKVARSVGVEHIEETLRERDLIDVVDSAVGKLDEPLADPSFLPTFLLSRLAAREVKVVLSGDGGDELWGGYPTYRAHRPARLYARVPRLVRRALVDPIVELLPIDDRYQSLEWKLRRFTSRFDDDPLMRHLRWMSNVDLPELAAGLPGAAGLRPETTKTTLPETSDLLQRVLVLDFLTYMSGSVLTKVDRASMAHGLEVRPPLLDNDMIDLALSIPSSYKVRRNTTKAVFRRAARGHLPSDILARPKKGFGIPLAAWLRGALEEPIRAIVDRSPVWDSGLVDRATFRTWNEEHQGRTADRSKPLWALFVLDRWLRRSAR